MIFRCFFFFKQKTAYEMRISDWSSDVCSSDLHARNAQVGGGGIGIGLGARGLVGGAISAEVGLFGIGDREIGAGDDVGPGSGDGGESFAHPFVVADRSEEHTSELQSLMRTSYAVFCLQKQMPTPKAHGQTTCRYDNNKSALDTQLLIEITICSVQSNHRAS